MIERLFSSKARAAILCLFFYNPKNRYYLRQIQAATRLPIRSVQRELNHLTGLHLLHREEDGNRVYFSLNQGFTLYPELKSLILKATGIGEALRKSVRRLKGVDFAFLYGSYASGTEQVGSDVDLFVIGNISPKDIHAAISQTAPDREVNLTTISKEEFLEKLKTKNHFVQSLVRTDKLFLKGSQDAFGEFAQAG